MSKKSTTLLIRVSPEDLEKWRAAAKKAETTVSKLVRESTNEWSGVILGPEECADGTEESG